MGVVATGTPITMVTTAETVLVTSPVLPVNNPSAEGIRIFGVVNLLTGAGTTLVTIRVRAGSGLTGALIGSGQQYTIGAAVNASIPYAQMDPTTVSPGVQYTVTIQAAGATGNGSVAYADMDVTPCTQFVG